MKGARLPGAFDHANVGFPCKNTVNEIIPPFACMAVTSIDREAGDDLGIGPMVVSVKKPTSTEEEDPNLARLVFNGPRAIPATSGGTTGRGTCFMDTPAFVQVAASGIALGATVGPIASTWTLSTSGTGFNVRKVWTSGSTYIALAEYGAVGGDGSSLIQAKTPAGGIPARSGTQMGSASCTPYSCNASGNKTLETLDDLIVLWNDTTGAVAGETDVSAIRNEAGLLVVVVEDCGGS